MCENYVFNIKNGGGRIDIFIAASIDGITRSAAQRLINDGNINVNGTAVKANYKLRENDEITVIMPPPTVAENIQAEYMPLEVLYEDEGMLVINKPQGIVVHPAPGHYSGTIVNALLHHIGQQNLSGINGQIRPGIVHRLDKDTSGVLAIAKNDFYHQSLSEQLKNREMSRKYKALLHGRLKNDNGVCENYIGRHKTDRKKMSVTDKLHGRIAITYYSVAERYSQPYTLIEASLKTGRTHQIRVHMASLGHPVVGDRAYGRTAPVEFRLEGQLLHAETIGFTNPRTRMYTVISAPLPNYFVKVIEKLRL